MNKIILGVLIICLMLSVSYYFYNVCSKHHVYKKDKNITVSASSNILLDNSYNNNNVSSNSSDEDIKYLQDKGWTVHNINNTKATRKKRSMASIANCVWRVLNYPYMYNFYPILNFGVSKIMTGLGDLITNIHFPLFSSTNQQAAPLSDSELQAQELAYAQGQALSQENHETSSVTAAQDTTAQPESEESKPTTPTVSPTRAQSLEYQDSKVHNEEDEQKQKEQEEMKEKEDEIRERQKLEEVNKKIDEKAEILAKKYVQMYFSQNKQQLLQDNSEQMSVPNNDMKDQFELANSLENTVTHTTDNGYDFNEVTNAANGVPVY